MSEAVTTPDLEVSLRALMPDLLGYFVRRLDDREDAADALADTLLVLWRHERKPPPNEEGRRRYAFGVARNILSTALSGSAATTRSRRSAAGGTRPVAAAEPLDPDLLAALAGLREVDRELVLLVAWEGFGVAEAGAVLGLKPDAARQRYGRARTALKSRLGASTQSVQRTR